MKTFYKLILLLFLNSPFLISNSFSQQAPGIEWQNTIGGSFEDRLYSAYQTNDGGYILGGHSRSNISGDKTENSLGNDDYWIVKLNPFGNIQWQNTIGGLYLDILFSALPTNDGGYILGGFSDSHISGDKTEASHWWDYWIIKVDSLGNIQWQNTIGGDSIDQMSRNSILQTNDGGYLIGGSSDSDISIDKTENSKGGNDFLDCKT